MPSSPLGLHLAMGNYSYKNYRLVEARLIAQLSLHPFPFAPLLQNLREFHFA